MRAGMGKRGGMAAKSKRRPMNKGEMKLARKNRTGKLSTTRVPKRAAGNVR